MSSKLEFKGKDFGCRCSRRWEEVEWHGNSGDHNKHFDNCDAAIKAKEAQAIYDKHLETLPKVGTYFQNKGIWVENPSGPSPTHTGVIDDMRELE